MKIFLTSVTTFWLFLVAPVYGHDEIPPAIQRILAQIPKIKPGDSLGEFFSRSQIKIDKDTKVIGGGSSLGEDGIVWQVGKSGKWIMCTTSARKFDKEAMKLLGELKDGEMIGVRVYYREKASEEVNYDKMQKQLPYLYGKKLHLKHEAEQGGADQPATAGESKLEDKEKPKQKSEVRPQ